jgi:hypothetical protein
VTVAAGQDFAFAVNIHADTTNNGDWDYYGTIELRDNACPDSVLNIGVIAYVLDAPARTGQMPERTALHSAYPNPFNSVTTVNFDLAAASDVHMQLFDVTGRMVKILSSAHMEAGRYRLPFDARDLASGVYLLAFQAGSERFSQKLLLIK